VIAAGLGSVAAIHHAAVVAWFQQIARQQPIILVMLAGLVGSAVFLVLSVRLYHRR
jgi:hypothetical protein